jgi:hypothetical protein
LNIILRKEKKQTQPAKAKNLHAKQFFKKIISDKQYLEPSKKLKRKKKARCGDIYL